MVSSNALGVLVLEPFKQDTGAGIMWFYNIGTYSYVLTYIVANLLLEMFLHLFDKCITTSADCKRYFFLLYSIPVITNMNAIKYFNFDLD